MSAVHTEGATEAERAAFEAWADDQGFVLKRVILGDDYQDLRTQGPWDAWQARAALSGWQPIADAVDAARWRRLVNASELPFPVAAIADDPENDRLMVYGRKRLEQFIDSLDLVSDKSPPAPNQGAAS
jgi:hypothetical protein